DRPPRRQLAAPLEVDQLAVHPVANRAPKVLLDLALAHRLGQAPGVVVERALGYAGGDQGLDRKGLRTSRLSVADAQLDRAERVVGPHAPPELGGLGDRV